MINKSIFIGLCFTLILPFIGITQDNKRELSVAASYQRDIFDRDFDEWNQFSLSLKSDGAEYVWIPKIQYTNRFDQFDWAGEVTVYRKFKNKDYAMFNAGISEGNIMARSQLQFIYYHSAGLWEINGGIHYLNFPNNLHFFGPQVGLSRYIGNFLGNITVKYFWDSQNEWPNNYVLQHSWRYYLQEASHFAVSAAYGYDNSLVIISDQLNGLANNPYLWNVGAYYQSKFFGRTAFRLSYTFSRYQLNFFERNQHSILLILEFKKHKNE